MRWYRRRAVRVGIGLACLTLVASACTSSKPASKSNRGTSQATAAGGGVGSQIGAGLATETHPLGSRQVGGTVYFAEGFGAPPNYIFPMTSPQVYGANNVQQLSAMLYKPLYWYGDRYSPTVDYDRSLAQKPIFSADGKTVTIKLNDYKWSDGEQVTARDLEFWINLYKADPVSNYCGYVPGLFPDNVTGMSSPDPQTLVLKLDKKYNESWFQYNELSQITPLPLAWDRTSLSAPAPTRDNGKLPDVTKAGAEQVYKFLDAQSKNTAGWATSPIWSVVDGPMTLTGFTHGGEVTLVPNTAYSGTPKPTISKLVEVPFSDSGTLVRLLRSQGTSALTIAGMPSEDAPEIPKVVGEGFTDNKAASYSFTYFVLNLNNPTVGKVFQQTYFRQALQHLVDQEGWIHQFLHDTAVPTYSPIPSSPSSPLVSLNPAYNPYPFSTQAASQLLTSHGWNVVPGGSTTCQSPGIGADHCGAGITQGQGISFNIDYVSGSPPVASEMNDLAAQAAKVGIKIDLSSHDFNSVLNSASQCTPGQAACNWTAENWSAGWIYAPDFLPTGESLFLSKAAGNYSNFSDPKADSLIRATIYGADEQTALTAYAKYMAESLPVVFGPTSIGTYGGAAGTMVDDHLGGYAANAFGYMDVEDWYFAS